MDIWFEQQNFPVSGLYSGYDDVPGLTLWVQLNGWEFPDPRGDGIGRFRVEIREEQAVVGSAFVMVTATGVLGWQAYVPRLQAMMDGICSQPEVQQRLQEIAAVALDVPIHDQSIASEGYRKKVPSKAYYNPGLHEGGTPDPDTGTGSGNGATGATNDETA
jgi:hypothetical protein